MKIFLLLLLIIIIGDILGTSWALAQTDLFCNLNPLIVVFYEFAYPLYVLIYPSKLSKIKRLFNYARWPNKTFNIALAYTCDSNVTMFNRMDALVWSGHFCKKK